MSATQTNAILAICEAVIDAVKAAGTHGAPGGVLYAALMAQGCTLNQFQSLMAGLVNAGLLRQSGNLYFATGKAVQA